MKFGKIAQPLRVADNGGRLCRIKYLHRRDLAVVMGRDKELLKVFPGPWRARLEVD